MRIQPSILACLLAGCAVQPATLTPLATSSDAHLLPIADPGELRISLEFLPPDERFCDVEPVLAEPRVEGRPSVSAERRAVQTVALRTKEPTRTRDLSRMDITSITDPVARETLRFCSDLISTDRRRVRREVGIPFFDFRFDDHERMPLLTSERRLRDDHDRLSQQLSASLLKRPLRLLARRLPVVREVDLALDDFRHDRTPWFQPRPKRAGDHRKLGRLSLRLRVRELRDPAEIVYLHPAGMRIGSTQRRAKFVLNIDLSDRIQLDLRARTEFLSGRGAVRADLIYQPSPRTSVHLAAGDDMDFLSSSSLYSLFDSPMDGAPGVVLYAVHTF